MTITRVEDDTGTRDEMIACGGVSPLITLWSLKDDDKAKSRCTETIKPTCNAVAIIKFFFREASLNYGAYVRSRMLAIGELP